MFWRETGINDEDDEVEAREGACSMETAMVRGYWAQGAVKKERVAVVDVARLRFVVCGAFLCVRAVGGERRPWISDCSGIAAGGPVQRDCLRGLSIR